MKRTVRIIPPEITPTGVGRIPEPKRVLLDNNIPVYLIEAGTEEIVRIDFHFPAGQIMETIPLTASTANAMLLEGSGNYNAEQINRMFDHWGAFPNLYRDRDSAGFIVFTLNKHLEKILSLSAEVLRSPVFPQDELNVLMESRLQKYLVNQHRVSILTVDMFFNSIFGNKHPYGMYPIPEDFRNIDRTMLVDFHKKYYDLSSMNIIVSGKIPPEIVTLLNTSIGGIKSQSPPVIIPSYEIKGDREKKKFIEKCDAVQTSIRIGSLTINKNHPDYPGLKIVDTILGGYFGSRLMKNIREDKGYTYGISSSVTSFLQAGFKMISTEVGSQYASQTKEEIYKEIRLLQNVPVTEDELNIARCFMSGEMIRMFDGPFALAESYRSVLDFGLDNNYFYLLAEKIKSIDRDEIIRLASTYYNIDDLYEVEAGAK